MCSAMIGLIFLQYYWLENAKDLRRSQLQQEIHAALKDVSVRLEQQEAVYMVRQQVDRVDLSDRERQVHYDAEGNAHWSEQQHIRLSQTYSSDWLAGKGMAYQIEEEAVISKRGSAQKVPLDSVVRSLHLEADLKDPRDVVPEKAMSMADKRALLTRMAQRSDLVNAVIRQMLVAEKRQVEDRISFGMVDSLITQQLKDRGIDMPYAFSVVRSRGAVPKTVYCSDLTKERRIRLLGYAVRLFPSDIFDNRYMLYVLFPDEEGFILSTMGTALLMSVCFVLLTFITFVYSVVTILRQRRVSEATADFINNMTHELKTPIATVALATEALLDPDVQRMPSMLGRYLNIIKEENHRLGRQVEKVLQIARIERSKLKLKIVEVDLNELVRKAAGNFAIHVENRKGQLSLALDAKLSCIEGDEVHLSSIVHNLVDNAIKYSPGGLYISVRTEDDPDGGVKLIVEDRGQGIPKESMGKVFDKFYRVPTGNVHNVKGFGLGLSYVRALVDAHYGQIDIRSEVGKGTVFSIYLPHRHGRND